MGNSGVGHIDHLGLVIATQEDVEYRNAVLKCLECCGEYEWVLDEEFKKNALKMDTFDEDGSWYFLRLKSGFKGTTDEETCGAFEEAIKKGHFIYLSKYTPQNGGKSPKKEILNNASALGSGGTRGVFLSRKAKISIPVEQLDDNGDPVTDEDGAPVYVQVEQEFCSILWHEMAGHAIAGNRRHPKNKWNDYEERNKDSPPANWGKSDAPIEIENQYRKKRG